jgi:Dimethlysulfonioproprionate lyase
MYQAGQISAAQLEAYRVAAGNDGDGPAALFAERGLPLPPATVTNAGQALQTLLDEADRYITTLPGPGIAEVRTGLAAQDLGSPKPAATSANAVVASHMAAALAPLSLTHPALAQAIDAALPHLGWITYDSYPLDQIGPAFGRAHAYTTLVGAEGNFVGKDFDLGLFLIAPHTLYRDHRHLAPELYAPLTGPHGWRFGPNGPLHLKPAHQPVWNDPLCPHLTKVGPLPFLALYCWIRDTEGPAEVLPAEDWAQLEAMRLGP